MKESRTQTPLWGTATPDSELLPTERLLEFPVTLKPDVRTRAKEIAVAFFLTPPALLSLLLATTSFLAWAAVGQPLSSPEAAVGLTVAGLLMLRVGMSATRTSAATAVVIGWSFLATILYWFGLSRSYLYLELDGFGAVAVRSSVVQLVLPSSWSLLPFLFLCVSLGAALATQVARVRRRRPPSVRASGHQTRAATVLALLSIVVIWLAALELAPTDISQVAVYGPAALGFTPPDPAGVLLLGGALFVLAASAGWGSFTTAWLTTLLLAVPALLIFPVSSSLGGTVATPGAPLSTALALAGPIVGALSVLTISLIWALHWVQTSRAVDVLERN